MWCWYRRTFIASDIVHVLISYVQICKHRSFVTPLLSLTNTLIELLVLFLCRFCCVCFKHCLNECITQQRSKFLGEFIVWLIKHFGQFEIIWLFTSNLPMQQYSFYPLVFGTFSTFGMFCSILLVSWAWNHDWIPVFNLLITLAMSWVEPLKIGEHRRTSANIGDFVFIWSGEIDFCISILYRQSA